MKLWKDYKIQLLLMLLAFSQLFAYFYPGYAKGTSFILLQALLTVAVIWLLIMEKNHGIHRRLH